MVEMTRTEKIKRYLQETYEGDSKAPASAYQLFENVSCNPESKVFQDGDSKMLNAQHYSDYFDLRNPSLSRPSNFDYLIAALTIAFPDASYNQQAGAVAALDSFKEEKIPKSQDLKNSIVMLQRRMMRHREKSAIAADNIVEMARMDYQEDVVAEISRWATSQPGSFSPTAASISRMLGNKFPQRVLANIEQEGSKYRSSSLNGLQEFRDYIHRCLQQYWTPDQQRLESYIEKRAGYSRISDEDALDLLHAVGILRQVEAIVKDDKGVESLRRFR